MGSYCYYRWNILKSWKHNCKVWVINISLVNWGCLQCQAKIALCILHRGRYVYTSMKTESFLFCFASLVRTILWIKSLFELDRLKSELKRYILIIKKPILPQKGYTGDLGCSWTWTLLWRNQPTQWRTCRWSPPTQLPTSEEKKKGVSSQAQ